MSNNLNRYITCQITFLDNTQHSFQIERHSKGQILLDKVFDYLELVEKDYFGLQFTSFVETNQIDAGIRVEDFEDTLRSSKCSTMNFQKWLDPTKSVRKQMLCPPFNLFFRVKFYVSDPVKLVEEYTRYHIFLQIKKDLYEGRLVCPENICTILASYAVQSEFGDYCPEEHGDHYLNDFKFIPNQDNNFLSKVVDLHKIRKGQTPAQAEFNFLEVAKTTELYGIELFNAKDEDGNSVNIGCCNRGIIIFRSNQQQNIFQWTTIMKLAFKKKLFSVYMKDEKSDDEIVRVFNMQNPEVCKVLWKNCIEHHTFFRLVAPPALPQKSFFNIGSRYRYSGKTEFQSIEEMKRRARVERSFQRFSKNPSRLTATNNGNGQYTQPAVTDNSSNVHSISSSYNTTKQQNTLLLLSLEAPNKMDMETISPKSKRDLIPILVEKQSSRKEVTSVDTVLR
ncbi:unnamed protein product [Dracunculus medinensis]|uniref:FERM domain-containing protein n=1 Tax=Dracunculus medinensis TaxID=318479 RepID=A0A0N4UE28_DRAME|nr:unnamed protein product [Dracunculus medinensis]